VTRVAKQPESAWHETERRTRIMSRSEVGRGQSVLARMRIPETIIE